MQINRSFIRTFSPSFFFCLFLNIGNSVFAASSAVEFDIPNKTYTITSRIDLKGKCVKIASGCVLKFEGGLLCNGSIEGHDTKIIYDIYPIFDNIKIKGDWNLPIIKSSLFVNFNNDNSICELFNLSSSKINNIITIENGEYWVSVNNSFPNAIRIKDNTQVNLNGNIRLRPTNLTTFSIINLQGSKNVKILGSGKLIGDLNKHMGKEGEWGMGIFAMAASNVLISDISIGECWGDCIYIGGNSHDVNILNVKLYKGRRQGISITSGFNITINKADISYIGGTEPQYAIDIEPNKNGFVYNVKIIDVTTFKSPGGIMVNGKARGAQVGKVSITNCSISSESKYAVALLACNDVKATNSSLKSATSIYTLYCQDVKKLYISKNKIHASNSFCKTVRCNSKIIKNNTYNRF